ncbi:PQQ-binding-like beta-propeller repeat protein [Candidatus Oscillochloris fontis]|uniref:outer membrane protein assembly factor BamB family protein n=1 Tax=Candidatus Oscillochloris fontis TaxID=2496868 RepID=UPI00101B91A6|nr:PQQ-binding-like beta-propeller repeat protein [Candidatus Oscillochloris fontis]
MREERRPPAGWIIPVVALLIGVLGGAFAMLSFLGLGMNEVIARMQGRAAPLLIEVTPTPVLHTVGGAAPGRRLVWRAPIPLDTDTSEPELLLISRNYDRDSDTLLLFSPLEGRVRWESPPMGTNGTSWLVAYSAATIIVADEARLIGLSRTDGSKVWEAPLTDRIFSNGCQDCLQVFGDVVVALSDDGQLQALNANKGTPLWVVRLHQTTRQLVRVGAMVGVPDSLEPDETEAGLFIYNPADGQLVRTIAPTCQHESQGYVDQPHYYDYILADPQSEALYWMLDSVNCLLRVGMGSFGGEERTFNPAFQNFEVKNTLVADGHIYLSSDQSIYTSDGQGQARLLTQAEDYNLRPLAARGSDLLVLAQRTRGSSRYELWLLDAQSGQQRWSRVLLGDDLVEDAIYDSGDTAVHLLASGVALIEQQADPEAISYELLNLNNGTSQVKKELRVEDAGDSLRGVTWGNQSVWLAVDELYAVDLTTGETQARWP